MVKVASHGPGLITFEATVHRTKNRLISIPAAIQRRLGLAKPGNRFLVEYSLRARSGGPWLPEIKHLTSNFEFAAPRGVRGGARVVVTLLGFFANVKAELAAEEEEKLHTAASVLLKFAGTVDDDRTDGSVNHDYYLYHSRDGQPR